MSSSSSIRLGSSTALAGAAGAASCATGATGTGPVWWAWARSTDASRVLSTGLVRKSSIPAARHFSRSPSNADAVIAMIGTRRSLPSAARICRVAAKPSSTGICRSIRIASYVASRGAAHRLLAVAGDVGGVAERLEEAERHQLVDLVVLDQQHVAVPEAVAATGSARARGGVRRAGCGTRRAVNQNVLPSPGTLRAPMSPPDRGDQLPRDGQAEPGAAVGAGGRGVGLAERLEQPVHLVLGGCRCRCR